MGLRNSFLSSSSSPYLSGGGGRGRWMEESHWVQMKGKGTDRKMFNDGLSLFSSLAKSPSRPQSSSITALRNQERRRNGERRSRNLRERGKWIEIEEERYGESSKSDFFPSVGNKKLIIMISGPLNPAQGNWQGIQLQIDGIHFLPTAFPPARTNQVDSGSSVLIRFRLVTVTTSAF